MLLTSEMVTTIEQAKTILQWYSYRWCVEEYHKLLKSGCQAERYRLAAEGYLEHRRKTPIGIQVLWRGWAKLHDLVEGWQLANQT